MIMPKKLSVATHVVILLVTTVSILLVLVGFAGYHIYSKQQKAELDQGLSLEADQLSAGIALAVWNLDHDQIRKIMESTMKDS